MSHTAFIAIGGNILPEGYASLEEVMTDAISELQQRDARVEAQSSWYETAPVPISDQPWFLNGVLRVSTTLSAAELLSSLHEIEANFGRVRKIRNEARILDLDLIDYEGVVSDDSTLQCPHPRMHQRAFVLLPLQDVAADWVHPTLQKSIAELIAEMPEGQQIRKKSSDGNAS